jgi:hypothetical protein
VVPAHSYYHILWPFHCTLLVNCSPLSNLSTHSSARYTHYTLTLHTPHTLHTHTHLCTFQFDGLQPSSLSCTCTPQLAATVVLSLCNTACACSTFSVYSNRNTEHLAQCSLGFVMLEDKHELRGEACHGYALVMPTLCCATVLHYTYRPFLPMLSL